jgi:TPR repeat protein
MKKFISISLAMLSMNMAIGMEENTQKLGLASFWKALSNDSKHIIFSTLEDRELLKVNLIDVETHKVVNDEFQHRSISLKVPTIWLKFQDIDTWSPCELYFMRKSLDEAYVLGVFSLEYYQEHGRGKEYVLHNWLKAARGGHALAQLNLGCFLLQGGSLNLTQRRENHESAKNLFRMASDRGEIEAQWRLGQIFAEEGKIEDSITYYTLAADQGHAFSQYNVAFILQGQKDIERAKKYYQLAANQENLSDQAVIRAQVNLGKILYDEGNMEKARMYWELAARQGNENAKKSLEKLINTKPQTF